MGIAAALPNLTITYPNPAGGMTVNKVVLIFLIVSL